MFLNVLVQLSEPLVSGFLVAQLPAIAANERHGKFQSLKLGMVSSIGKFLRVIQIH